MSTSTTTSVVKKANKYLSEYDYGRLAGAFLYKGNFAQISRDLDLPKSTVQSPYKRLQKTQITLPKTSTGRKRLLSQTGLNAISQNVRRRPTESIFGFWPEGLFVRFSSGIDSYEVQISCIGKKKKPALKQTRKKLRLAWIKERLNWARAVTDA